MANFDIYDDLDLLHVQEKQKAAEDLQWKEKYEIALETIEKLQNEKKGLNKKIKQLEQNFTSLLETARSEIKRKDNQIAELRKEKDNICFRRNVRMGNNPFSAIGVGEESRREGGKPVQLAPTNSATAAFGSTYEQSQASTSRERQPDTNCSNFGLRAKFANEREPSRVRGRDTGDRKGDRTSNHGPSDNDRSSSKAESSGSNHERNDTKHNRNHSHRIDDYKTKNDYGKEKHHKDKNNLYKTQNKDLHIVNKPTVPHSKICSKENSTFVEKEGTSEKSKIACMEEDILKDVKELKKKKKSKDEGELLPKEDNMKAKNSSTFFDALFDDMLLKNETGANDLSSDLKTSEAKVTCPENGPNKMNERTDENCNLEMQQRTPLKQNVDTLFDELFGLSPAPSMTIAFERSKSSSSIGESVSDYSEIAPVSSEAERASKCIYLDKGTIEKVTPLNDANRNLKCKNAVTSQNSPNPNNINKTCDPEKLPIEGFNSHLSQDEEDSNNINCKDVLSDVESPLYETLDSPCKLNESSVNAYTLREPYFSSKDKPKKEHEVITARGKQECGLSVPKNSSEYSGKETTNNIPTTSKRIRCPSDDNSSQQLDKKDEIIKKDSQRHSHSSKHHKNSSCSKPKSSSKDSHRSERARDELDEHHRQPKYYNYENCEKTKTSSCSREKKESSKSERHRLSRIMKEKDKFQLEKRGSVSPKHKDQSEHVAHPFLEEENSSDLKLFQDQSFSLHCDDVSDEEGIEVTSESYLKEGHHVDVCLNNDKGINLHDDENQVDASMSSQNEEQQGSDAAASVLLSKLNELTSNQEVETDSDRFCYSPTTALPLNKKSDTAGNGDFSLDDVQLSNPEASCKNTSLDLNASMNTTGINESVHNGAVDLKSNPIIENRHEVCEPTNDNQEIDSQFVSIEETKCKTDSKLCICNTTDLCLTNAVHSTSGEKTQANLSSQTLDITSKEDEEIRMNIEESQPGFSEDMVSSVDLAGEKTKNDRKLPHIHSSPSDVTKVTAQKSDSTDNKEDSYLSGRRRKLKTPRKLSDEEHNLNETATKTLMVQLVTKSGKTKAESTTTVSEHLKSPNSRRIQTEMPYSVQTKNILDIAWNSIDSTSTSIAPLPTLNEQTKYKRNRKTQAESNSEQTFNLFEAESKSNDLPTASTVSLKADNELTKSPSISKTQAGTNSGKTEIFFDAESNSTDLASTSTVSPTEDDEQTKPPSISKTQAEINSGKTENLFDAKSNSTDLATTSTVSPTEDDEQTKPPTTSKMHTESTNSVKTQNSFEGARDINCPTTFSTLSQTVESEHTTESTNSGQTRNLFESVKQPEKTVIVPVMVEIEPTSPSNSQTKSLHFGQTQEASKDNPGKSLNLSNNDGETQNNLNDPPTTKSEKPEKGVVSKRQKDKANTIFTADYSKSNVSCNFVKDNPSVPKSDGKIHHKKRFLQHTGPYFTKPTAAQDSKEPTSIADTIFINKQKRLATKLDPRLTDTNTITTNDLQMKDIQEENTIEQVVDTRNGEIDVARETQNQSSPNHFEHERLNTMRPVKKSSLNSEEILKIDTTSPPQRILPESPSSVGITTNRIENSSTKYKKRILQHFTDSHATVAINSCISPANDQEATKLAEVTRCDIKRKRTVPKITKIVADKVKEQHDGQSEVQVQRSVEIKKKPSEFKVKISEPEAINALALDSCRSLIVSVAKVKFPLNKNSKPEDISKAISSSPPIIQSSSLYAHDVCSRSKITTKNQKLSSPTLTCKDNKDPHASPGHTQIKSSTRTKRRRKVSTSPSNTSNETEEIACSIPKRSRKVQNDEASTNTCDQQSPSNYKPAPEANIQHKRPSSGEDSLFGTTIATPTHHQIFSNDVFPEDYQNSQPLVYNSDGDDVQYTELDNRMASIFQSPSYVNANEGCSYDTGDKTSIEMDGSTLNETLHQSEKSQCDTSSSSRKISVGSNNYIIEPVGALTANVFITRKKSKKHVKIPQVAV